MGDKAVTEAGSGGPSASRMADPPRDRGTSRSASRPVLWATVALLLVLCLASAMILAGFAGAFGRTLHFRGPFQADGTPGSHLVSVQLPGDDGFACCAKIRDDSGPDGSVSKLRLWINGVEAGPPHTLHDNMRHGDPGFSHWGNQVYFALPDQTPNSAATEVVVHYPYWLRVRLAVIPVATLALALALVVAAFRRDKAKAERLLIAVGGNLVLAIFALLTVVWIVLQLGLAHSEQTFTGPFSGEQNTQLKAVDVKPPVGVLACCVQIPSDQVGQGNASRLRLWLNGKKMPFPHTPHEQIRKGSEGFSHWGKQVYFALPQGTDNSGRTRVHLTVPLKPLAWTALFPVLTLALFIGLHGRRTVTWIRTRPEVTILAIKSPYLALYAFGWAVLAAGGAYLATILWGLITGEALPPAIPFRSELGKSLVDVLDPAIPLCMLMLAVLGVAAGWLGARSPYKNGLRQAEVSGIRWMRRYGLFCLVMFYLASVGATWAGEWRSGTNSSFSGLVPYYDAAGYFADVHRFLRTGRWSELMSQRPLAAAFRTASFGISDFRFDVVLLWEVVATAGATFFTTMIVARWRGLWAGVVFMALIYIAVRSHLPTVMTEALGLPIAIVALGFLAEALRTSSKGHALLGIGLLMAAMWIRPGPNLVIPALALWYAWSFNETLLGKLKDFLIACSTIIAVLAVDRLLGVFFGVHTTGNLSELVCGWSIGGTWSACVEAYPQEYAKVAASHDAYSAWLYTKAFHNILHDPGPFIHTIVHEPIGFWTEAPRFILQGYSETGVPQSFPSVLWLLTIPVFGELSLRKRNARVELPFWILVFAGLTASAMFFYISDGVRAMALAYPMLGLFIAAVFSSPPAPHVRCPRTARREVRLGAILTAAATAGLFVLLPIERRIYPLPSLALAPGENAGDTTVVGDFARSTGVLVVADGQPLPHGVSALHFSEFAELVHDVKFEASQGILSPRAPAVPFGFIDMPMLDRPGTITLLTPPEMMTRQDVRAWHVVSEDWDPTGRRFSANWRHVVSATPYSKPLGK